MPNKKTKPAARKSAAGKTNSKKNNLTDKQKKRLEDEKRAQKIIEEKQKAQKLKQKKSEEIQKRREKESEKKQKEDKKVQNKSVRKDYFRLLKKKLKNFWKRIKYYTSKDFLDSFNYVRVFIFLIVPIVLIVFSVISISKLVPLNVPAEIRNYEYNGRLESEQSALPSSFNNQQQQVFIDSLDAEGSGKFDFYINSVVRIDDNSCTDALCFGNPSGNNYVLIATIFDKDNKVIYRSLGLESGKELNEAKMFENLPYGLHNVKVSVNAYDKKTKEIIGTKYAKIKLAVGVDENGK